MLNALKERGSCIVLVYTYWTKYSLPDIDELQLPSVLASGKECYELLYNNIWRTALLATPVKIRDVGFEVGF